MTIIAHNILREMQVKLKCQSFSSSSKKKVKVLLLQNEMSSKVYAWQEITKSWEIEFIIVPHPTSSQGWTPIILQILQDHDYNVDICCLPQVHWSYIDLALISMTLNLSLMERNRWESCLSMSKRSNAMPWLAVYINGSWLHMACR